MTTKIEWCDETVNPIRAKAAPMGPGDPENMRWEQVGWHCEHVDEGCRHCYAERLNVQGIYGRIGTGLDYKPSHFDQGRVQVFLDEAVLAKVLRWKKPRAIFWCSMTDLFGRFVTDEQRDRAFATMALTPQHRHIVLTKRPERALEWLGASETFVRVRKLIDEPSAIREEWFKRMDRWQRQRTQEQWWSSLATDRWPLPNVYIGTSVSSDKDKQRLEDLLRIAAIGWKVWVSYEPALGAVEWGRWLPCPEGGPGQCKGPQTCSQCDLDRDSNATISGLVCGGESGGKEARPMHPDWARSARDACAAAGVPYHFKQWGEWIPRQPDWHGDRGCGLREHRFDDGRVVARVGKKAAGRLLDGVQHDDLPWRTP